MSPVTLELVSHMIARSSACQPYQLNLIASAVSLQLEHYACVILSPLLCTRYVQTPCI